MKDPELKMFPVDAEDIIRDGRPRQTVEPRSDADELAALRELLAAICIEHGEHRGNACTVRISYVARASIPPQGGILKVTSDPILQVVTVTYTQNPAAPSTQAATPGRRRVDAKVINQIGE